MYASTFRRRFYKKTFYKKIFYKKKIKSLINTLLSIQLSRAGRHHAIIKRNEVQQLITNSQSRWKERCSNAGEKKERMLSLTVLGNPRFGPFVVSRINLRGNRKSRRVQRVILTWRMPGTDKIGSNCSVPVISLGRTST